MVFSFSVVFFFLGGGSKFDNFLFSSVSTVILNSDHFTSKFYMKQIAFAFVQSANTQRHGMPTTNARLYANYIFYEAFRPECITVLWA